jgi:formamidopyrimidine-DNA glycosylase
MPELPEVEITARRLSSGLEGASVESAVVRGMVTMRTVDPPIDALVGQALAGVRRIGKMLVVDFGSLSLLVHLMSAGRLQLHDKRASVKDRTARILVRLDGGRELRLREFGTQQRAWAKLLDPAAVSQQDEIATLGPDAWPTPPLEVFSQLMAEPRHLHPLLRDQRVIAGIGRSWVDEILWEARLSPFQRGSDLEEDAVEQLREACDRRLGDALEHYEEVIEDVIPDKLPMPLRVHRRHGQPCPRCGATLEAVHYKDYVMTYCPPEQSGGRVYKDRRLSRLLK